MLTKFCDTLILLVHWLPVVHWVWLLFSKRR